MATTHRRELFVSPTGTGKTRMLAEMAVTLCAAGASLLVLTHRNELLYQLGADLEEAGLYVGYIKAGLPEDRGAQVQLAQVQSLNKRTLPPVTHIMVDECHRNDFDKVLSKYPAARIIGFTASPILFGNKVLSGKYDGMTVAITYPDAVDRGYILAPKMWIPHSPDLRNERLVAGDYTDEDMVRIMSESRVVGGTVEAWQRHSDGRMTLGYAVNIQHAEQQVAAFQAAGITSGLITGSTNSEVRTGLLARLRTGTLKVLWNVDVFAEGLNIPELQTIILSAPTRSLAKFLQRCGRGCRAIPGKFTYFVLDHAGCIPMHGPPHQHRAWTLDGEAWRAASRQGISVRMCSKCFLSYEGSGPCPDCGAEIKAQKRRSYGKSGELIEVAELPPEAIEADRRGREADTRVKALRQARSLGIGPAGTEAFVQSRMRKLYDELGTAFVPADPKQLW